MLALAESIKLPILLVGVPGTGKTKTVVDYAKAYLENTSRASARLIAVEEAAYNSIKLTKESFKQKTRDFYIPGYFFLLI